MSTNQLTTLEVDESITQRVHQRHEAERRLRFFITAAEEAEDLNMKQFGYAEVSGDPFPMNPPVEGWNYPFDKERGEFYCIAYDVCVAPASSKGDC